MVANTASAAATYTFYVSGSAVGQTAPGVAKDYTLNITNLNATSSISFNLSVVASPQGWTAQVSQTSFTVAASATRQITLSVVPPSTSLADAIGQYVNVTATPDDNTTAQTVSTTTRVTELFGVDVTLIPQAGTSGDPGQNVTWLSYVKNTGNSQQTYTVTVNNTSYTSTNLTTNLVTVSPGDSRVILVTINFSTTAPVGVLYSRIMATSTVNSSVSGSVLFSASVNAKRAVGLSGLTPDDLIGQTEAEDSLTFRNILVENKGNVADSYTLLGSANASRHGDWITFDSTAVSLAAFAQRYLNVTVTVPSSITGTGSYTAEFRIVSDNSTSVIAFLNLTIEIQPKHDLKMVYENLVAKQSGDPGTVVAFAINVSNPGAYDQRVDLTYSGINSAWVTFSANPFALSPNGFKIVYVNFTIPGTESPSTFNFQVLGSINWTDPSRDRTVDLTLEVRQVYDVIASSTATAASALPGGSLAFTIKVQNNGTGPDNFTVSATNATQAGSLSFSSTTLTLAAGAYVNITVTISITSAPAPAAAVYYYAITAKSSGNVSRVSTVNLGATVLQVYSLSASVTPSYQTGDPGATIQYTLSVVNSGNGLDTVTLQKSGVNQTWISFPVGNAAIVAGARVNFTVNVMAPSWSPVGDTALTVRVNSSGDVNVSVSPTLTVSLNPLYQFQVISSTTAVPNAHRSSIYNVSVTLRNSGNQPDTFLMGLRGDDVAWASLAVTSYTLVANENVTFIVRIATPAEPPNGPHAFTVNATSLYNSTVVAEDSFDVLINDIFGPELRLADSEFFAQPYSTVTLFWNARNNGTLGDRLQLFAVARLPAAQYQNTTTSLLSVGASVNGTFAVVMSYPFSGTYLVEFHLVSLTNQSYEAWAFANITLQVIRIVDVTVVADIAQGGPNDVFNFTLTVRNMGNITDTYSMLATAPSLSWNVTYSQNSFTLAPNASLNITVYLAAPPSLISQTYNTLVAAISNNASAVRDIVTLRVTVTYVVSLQPTSTTAQLLPGASRTFDLIVRNDGSADDTYALAPTGQIAAWVTIVPSTLAVEGGQSATVQVTVTVPLGEHEGARSFAVGAASLGSTVVSPGQAFAITVDKVFAFVASGPSTPVGVLPGQRGTFVLTLTNTGNVNDSFTLVATPSTYVTFSALPEKIDALVSINFSVFFSPPNGTSAGNLGLRVTILAGGGGSTDVLLSATILPFYNVSATAVPPGDLFTTGKPGDSLTVLFEVSNRGNTNDTANWSLVGPAADWATVVSGSKFLTAGNSATIELEFTVPSDLFVGTAGFHAFQVLVQSQGAGALSLRTVNGSLNVTALPAITLSFSETAVEKDTNVTVDRATSGILEFTLFVRNTGNRDETITLSRSLLPGWTIVVNATGGSTLQLAPGQVGRGTVRISSFPPGVLAQDVTLDASTADRRVSQRAVISVAFTTPDPQIVVSSISSSTTSLDAGQTVQVTFDVRNAGDGTATNVQVELLANGAQVDQASIASIPPRGSVSVTLRWTTPSNADSGPNQLAVGVVGAGSEPAPELQVNSVDRGVVQRLTSDLLFFEMLGIGLVAGIVLGFLVRGGRRGERGPAAPVETGAGEGDPLAGLAALEAEGGSPADATAAPSGSPPGVEHKVVCPNCDTEQWIVGSEGECKNCGVIIEVATDDEPAPEGAA